MMHSFQSVWQVVPRQPWTQSQVKQSVPQSKQVPPCAHGENSQSSASMQVMPSPVQPALQAHSNEPGVLVQKASSWHDSLMVMYSPSSEPLHSFSSISQLKPVQPYAQVHV